MLCTPCNHFARHIHSLHSLDVEKIGILRLSDVKCDGYVGYVVQARVGL